MRPITSPDGGARRPAASGLGDEAGAQAARADPDVAMSSIRKLRVHTAEVRPLNALGLDVRVADVVSDPTLLEANCTMRGHSFPSGTRVPLALADGNRKRAPLPGSLGRAADRLGRIGRASRLPAAS